MGLAIMGPGTGAFVALPPPRTFYWAVRVNDAGEGAERSDWGWGLGEGGRGDAMVGARGEGAVRGQGLGRKGWHEGG